MSNNDPKRLFPEYRAEAMARREAMGAGHYYLNAVSHRAHKGYVDILFQHGHTIRFWDHGPLTLLDCTGGSIGDQDASFIFGAGWACQPCMELVSSQRWAGGACGVDGSWDTYLFMRDRYKSKDDAHKATARTRRDAASREIHEALRYDLPLAQRYKVRLERRVLNIAAQDESMKAWSVTVIAGRVLAVEASVHQRPFRKSHKYLYLHVPLSLAARPDSELFIGGMLCAGVVLRTDTELIAWAVRFGTPASTTEWRHGVFRRDANNNWAFHHWRRSAKGK